MRLNVKYHDRLVGTLSDEEMGKILFAYDPVWVREGLDLSPLHLPRRLGIMENSSQDLLNLPGVFWDSLPDAWGLQVMRRHFKTQGISETRLTPLHLLAYLHKRSMGALTYHLPEEQPAEEIFHKINLAALAVETQKFLEGNEIRVSPDLERVGSSAGGARPKILVAVRDKELLPGEGVIPEGHEAWLIKISVRDFKDADSPSPCEFARMEYAYSLMARAAAIAIPPTRLFADARHRVHFGVKRFDRISGDGEMQKIHFQSFAGLQNHFQDSDYSQLFGVTAQLCRDYQQLTELLRRTAFNIAACNCDDHAKNFGFTMSAKGNWRLSPAYDMTYAPLFNGARHSMGIDRNMEPRRADLQALARQHSIESKHTKAIVDEVMDAVSQWDKFAREADLQKEFARQIQNGIEECGLPALRNPKSISPSIPPPPRRAS